MSALAEISKRNRDTARGGGTGAAVGGGLATAGLAGLALRYRKPLKELSPLLRGFAREDGSHVSGRSVKAITAGGLGLPIAASAGVGSAAGAGVGRKRENPGAALNAKKKSVKKFASRDENSSVGTTITWTGPQGPWRAPTLKAVARGTEGRSRGVGRHLTRDENSSPGVVHMTARGPSGKYVSHTNDLQVFHPSGRRSNRGGKASELQRYVSGGVKKSSLAPDGARVGRRLPMAKGATPIGAGRLANLATTAKNPQVQTRALSALERNLISQRKARMAKAATPVGAGRLTALALKTKNPQVQNRAFSALERNLASQRKARMAAR